MLALLKLVMYLDTEEPSEHFRAACSLLGTSVRRVICVVAKLTHTLGVRENVCAQL